MVRRVLGQTCPEEGSSVGDTQVFGEKATIDVISAPLTESAVVLRFAAYDGRPSPTCSHSPLGSLS